MLNVFISYSHEDKGLRGELDKHLAVLRYNSAISSWHDRRIGPGEEIDDEIDTQLAAADIILLLISADFLNSDYCYKIEMKRAMDRHEKGTARVIPVILRPCDWLCTPFGKLSACPPDGKPVVKHETNDDGFLAVVQDVRRAVDEFSESAAVKRQLDHDKIIAEKIPREFTNHDRQKFINEAHEFICLYFEHSLQDLRVRNIGLEASNVNFEEFHFAAHVTDVYLGEGQCQIWLVENSENNYVLCYSNGIVTADGSSTVSMCVGDDGFFLFL